MDPNTNLAEQLELADDIVTSSVDPDLVECYRLAELVLALNEWILKGGSLPNSWSKAQKRARQ